MTTRDELRLWFDEGVAQGASHLVIATDTWDWEDFPIYVRADQDVSAIVQKHQADEATRVMEVYDLGADRAEQLEARRTWALENPEPKPIQLPPFLQGLFPDLVAKLAVPFLRNPRRPA